MPPKNRVIFLAAVFITFCFSHHCFAEEQLTEEEQEILENFDILENLDLFQEDLDQLEHIEEPGDIDEGTE